MRSLIFYLVIFVSVTGFAQFSKKSAEYKGDVIEFKILFNSNPIPDISANSDKTVTGFTDETRGGELLLPQFDLFVIIPFDKIKEYNISEDKFSYQTFSPAINPGIVKQSDSTISYNFDPGTLNKINSPARDVAFKGIFRYKFWNVAHFVVKPYNFISSSSQLRMTEEFTLSIKLDKNIRIGVNPVKISTDDPFIKNMIINPDDAVRFSVSEDKPTEDSTYTWIDFNADYVKLGVGADGVYKVTGAQLQSLGVNLNGINPATVKLFSTGVEIPIHFHGEEDQIFNETDYVEFSGVKNYGSPDYRTVNPPGTPYFEYMNSYSDTTIYWITWGGLAGKRVNKITSTGTASENLSYYMQKLHFEKEVTMTSLSSDPFLNESPFIHPGKTWYGDPIFVGKYSYNFTVSDPQPGVTGQVLAKYVSAGGTVNQNTHLIGIRLNDNPQNSDSQSVNINAQVILKGSFISDSLKNGTNKVVVENYTTESQTNMLWNDWVELEYPRQIKARNDSISVMFPFLNNRALRTFDVLNIIGDSVQVWKMEGEEYLKIFPQKSAGKISITDTIGPDSKYFITSNSAQYTPRFYYKKKFRNLRNPELASDMIIVAPTIFIQAADEHASEVGNIKGIKTLTADIEDIQDEFSFGQLDPEGLRSFLRFASQNWQSPQARYVFLLGQAVGSLRFNFGGKSNPNGKWNLLYSWGLPGSDIMFTVYDTTGAYVQQLLIGRLSARKIDQIREYTQRYKAYHSQRYTEWNKSALLFSGGNFNDPNQIEQFKELHESVKRDMADIVPNKLQTTHFYKTVNPVSSLGPYTPEQIKQTMDKGGLFLSYVGHSGVSTWDNGIISAEQLINKENKNPLVTDFGCATGSHTTLAENSFSEYLTTSATGGAINYIGNASLGFVSTSLTAPKEFYGALLRDSIINISDAHRTSKLYLRNKFGNSGPIRVFALMSTLFGDPTVNIAVPPKPNLVISATDLILESKMIDDKTDSVKIAVRYKNLGKVAQDSVKLRMLHFYKDTLIQEWQFKRAIPSLADSILTYLFVKSKPGIHRLTISLNNENTIDEIYNDDNSAQLSFEVFGSEFLTTLSNTTSMVFDSSIVILTPRGGAGFNNVRYEIASNPLFENPTEGSVTTQNTLLSIPINNLNQGSRYWFRLILPDGTINSGFSFIKGSTPGYQLSDSTGFASGILSGVAVKNNRVVLDSLLRSLRVYSAGLNAGRTAIVELDRQNYIGEATITGTHFCIFSRDKFEFLEYRVFPAAATGAPAQAIYDFLDGLDSTKVLVGAVADWGGFTPELRTRLKRFGARLVDNVGFRHSWSFIGFAGADSSQVKEVWKTTTQGPAVIDSTVISYSTAGYYQTEMVGPVKVWGNLSIVSVEDGPNSITHRLLGEKTDGTVDTLSLNVNGANTDLSSVNTSLYRKISLLTNFKDDGLSRKVALNSVNLNFTNLPEIAVNSKSITLEKDTVRLNDSIKVDIKIGNGGYGVADSFYVNLDLIIDNNEMTNLLRQKVSFLGAGDERQLSYFYKSQGLSGTKKLRVTLDPQNYVPEFYEDNNTAEITFTEVLGFDKPFVKTQFNGQDIYDGDFVSNKPEITVDLYDPSTSGTVDTTLIRLLLNNKRIFMSSPEVTFSLRNTNPRVSLSYKPNLAAGEYELKVTGTGASGTPIDSAGSVRNFVVSDENKILLVYNYPNPFVSETYFTFKATNLPDEVQILIYTVAGRMIKKISKTAAELRYDFNKIYWDGRDEDGDIIASGTYLYRVIMKKNGETQTVTEKLSVVR